MVLWFRIKICTSITCLPRYVSSHDWFLTESSSYSSESGIHTKPPREAPRIFTKYQRNMQNNDSKLSSLMYDSDCQTESFDFQVYSSCYPRRTLNLGLLFSEQGSYMYSHVMLIWKFVSYWKLESSCHIISSVCRKCKIIQLRKRYQRGKAKQDT